MKDAIGGLLSAARRAALRCLATGAVTRSVAPASPPRPNVASNPAPQRTSQAAVRIEVIVDR